MSTLINLRAHKSEAQKLSIILVPVLFLSRDEYVDILRWLNKAITIVIHSYSIQFSNKISRKFFLLFWDGFLKKQFKLS